MVDVSRRQAAVYVVAAVSGVVVGQAWWMTQDDTDDAQSGSNVTSTPTPTPSPDVGGGGGGTDTPETDTPTPEGPVTDTPTPESQATATATPELGETVVLTGNESQVADGGSSGSGEVERSNSTVDGDSGTEAE